MKKMLPIAGIILSSAVLSACYQANPYGYANYRSYVDEGRPLYPESYEADIYYRPFHFEEKKQVVVPQTYHVGPYNSPVSHREQDKNWVTGQNPQAYTIEVADQEKAAEVAGKLSSVPKSGRQAEIRYEREGKTYYKGLYGTYPNYEEAQKAMSTLPAEVQSGAKIQNWGSVQNSVNQ